MWVQLGKHSQQRCPCPYVTAKFVTKPMSYEAALHLDRIKFGTMGENLSFCGTGLIHCPLAQARACLSVASPSVRRCSRRSLVFVDARWPGVAGMAV